MNSESDSTKDFQICLYASFGDPKYGQKRLEIVFIINYLVGNWLDAKNASAGGCKISLRKVLGTLKIFPHRNVLFWVDVRKFSNLT